MGVKSRNLWPVSFCSVSGSCLNFDRECQECFKKDRFKSLKTLKKNRYVNRMANEGGE